MCDGPARENDGVWPFIINGVRPGIRIFKDAVGKAGFETIILSVQVLQAVLHIADIRARTKKVVLVIEPEIAANLRRADVQFELGRIGIHVELFTASVARVAGSQHYCSQYTARAMNSGLRPCPLRWPHRLVRARHPKHADIVETVPDELQPDWHSIRIITGAD